MWKAFVFGAVVAGAIGPIALLVFGTAARQGFAAGAFAGLGAALADFLYALAAFSIGALVMPLVAAHEKSIAVACALLLIGLGAAMLLRLARGSGGSGHGEARRSGPDADLPAHDREPDDARRVRGHRAAAARGGLVREGGGFALALAAGSVAVQLAIAGSGAALGRAMPGENGRRAITAAAAAGIVAFGIYGLASAF